MTAREFRDWQIFEAEHPLPDALSDLHNALLCVVASNIMRGEGSQPARLEDFLILKPRPEPETERPTAAPAMTEAEIFRRQIRGY
jgi:hypothetical protein